MAPIPGLHHVTAIASDPQPNVDFHVSVLGLRLVKRTVNFDDPTTYHLYYGDDAGHPGTILTFFPWPGMPRGRRGTGQVTATAFAVPAGSLEWWGEWLAGRGADLGPLEERFGERVLRVEDPDGFAVELIEQPGAAARSFWSEGPIPAPNAIRGFHGVTLMAEGYERTETLLTQVMGFTRSVEDRNRFRYVSGHDAPGATVDLVCAPGGLEGRMGAGAVHHIAFRCASAEDQRAWRSRLAAAGMNVTPVIDRRYFQSVYFREPGGVLFEIATDPPGFTLDERAEALGTELKLPPWLEAQRGAIEERLPRLRLPALGSPA